ncbi:RagB/SusD family nutrient uptake outer membrane protein [Pseudozobellia thermophila]|uniref:Starch-binding associating with outer membrane n=1 Tax=Pseudozobellia thermophila TaxID=192903 RepID=A0A1M6GAM8_9FLAO|nr:RagB/SusD family nutrient uptake outer membrane protein [Pseudozobellia thermophila]SHJ06998.1 Starch-binding associating with outer membrane [Pseudozobellia thermophila]
MKKLYKNLLFLIPFVATVSCTSELDNDPIGLLTLDQVDTDPTLETVESAVESAYQPLRNTLNGLIPDWRWDLGTVFRNDIILQDMAANDMNKKWNPDGDQAWMDEIGNFNFTPENQAFNGIWTYDYEGVSRSNLAIGFLTDEGIVGKTGISESRRNQLLSEVYFLRAYYYFDLVNNFGDVPLILKSPDSFEEAFSVSVRAPRSEVLDQIAIDLQSAKELAPRVKNDATDPWRVSIGAVIALQAKIALYNENWSEVLSLIAELDNLGFYGLNDNYFDAFDASKEFNDQEVIFAYDHRSGENPVNGNGLAAVAGWGFFAPTEDFLAAFEPNDPRLAYTINVAGQHSPKIMGAIDDYKGNDDSPGNKVYIRYADVLLWKAEALNESGKPTEAIPIINQIRERAKNTPTADGTVVPEATLAPREETGDQAQVRTWIQSERRVELGFESHRFNDLKRWGIAETVLQGLGKNFQAHNKLYPIPQTDIDKSGGTITQNPGY